jgi:hypothetical protein
MAKGLASFRNRPGQGGLQHGIRPAVVGDPALNYKHRSLLARTYVQDRRLNWITQRGNMTNAQWDSFLAVGYGARLQDWSTVHTKTLMRDEQLHLATHSLIITNSLYEQWFSFMNDGTGLDAGQMEYKHDLQEYPNKVKKFFLPGTSLRTIPTQNLNIQTSTFKTNWKVFTERYGPIRGPNVFQEFQNE